MSVVSLLAYKHGIHVTLSAGSPGLTVDITLPSSLFGPIDVPLDRGAATYGPSAAPLEDESIVAWSENDRASASFDEAFQPVAGADTIGAPRSAQPSTPYGGYPDDEERAVTASDWTKMAISLSAFKSGQQSATDTPATFAYDEAVDTISPVTASDEFTDDDTNEMTRPVTAYAESFDDDRPVTDDQLEPIAHDTTSNQSTDDDDQPVTTYTESFDTDRPVTDDQLEPIAHDTTSNQSTDDIDQPAAVHDNPSGEFIDDDQPVTAYAESFDTDQPVTDDQLEPIAHDTTSNQSTDDIDQPAAVHDNPSGEFIDDDQPVTAYAESFDDDQPVTASPSRSTTTNPSPTTNSNPSHTTPPATRSPTTSTNPSPSWSPRGPHTTPPTSSRSRWARRSSTYRHHHPLLGSMASSTRPSRRRSPPPAPVADR